jgi:hypothetical protein
MNVERLRVRKGHPENLRKGKKKGDPPSRRLSEQKVKDFCLFYLTHGESIKAAGLHVGLSLTYVYEFFSKPPVQTKLREMRAQLDAKVLEAATQRMICRRRMSASRPSSRSPSSLNAG